MGNRDVFASNLKLYMELTGKTRNDISEALGISYFTVSDWVNGKKYPRMDKVEMLANYFNIQKSDLIEDKTNQPAPDKPLTEGEQMWMELYHKLSDETRGLLIKTVDSFDSLSQDKQEFALRKFLAVLGNQ
jgi:transcriptional regulator with XRE-family HTH domain